MALEQTTENYLRLLAPYADVERFLLKHGRAQQGREVP